jgi:hypothetical protein
VFTRQHAGRSGIVSSLSSGQRERFKEIALTLIKGTPVTDMGRTSLSSRGEMGHTGNFSQRRCDRHEFFIRRVVEAVARHPLLFG